MNVSTPRGCVPQRPLLAILITAYALGLSTPHAAAAAAEEGIEASSGPIRLNRPQFQVRELTQTQDSPRNYLPAPYERKYAPYRPGEFEIYVQKFLEPTENSEQIKRLGADLLISEFIGEAGHSDTPRQIPADYLIGVGDEIQLSIWGTIDADLRLTVDNGGRIVVPRVGPIMIAGLRYGDLNTAIQQRVARVFKGFEVSATLGKLKGIRVYVTGFAQRPGSYSISSLSTLVNALNQAGGPSAAGSFRQIELRRVGRTAIKFDLYDLLLKGDRSADLGLQAEDVIHITPVGPQIAVLGSVNRPVVAELKPGETIGDAIRMAGGFNPVADRSRLSIERVSERNDRRVTEVALPSGDAQALSNGDVIRVFSNVASTLPQHKQYKRIRVEGEVQRPGEYILPPHSTINEALQAAGGLTPSAFVFGTEFMRESVRIKQQENYDRALRDMETEFARAAGTQRASTAEDAAIQQTKAASTSRLIDRLKAVRPTGRIVLQLSTDASSLPELALEEGDRILIPARPTTVGVFGSVFNNGSFLWKSGSSIDDALRSAGGPTRGADASSTFVVRANGSVISAQQTSGGWVNFGNTLSSVIAQPGDTVFVPEEMNKTTFMQSAKEWTQILYQFGIGAAALKTIKN